MMPRRLDLSWRTPAASPNRQWRVALLLALIAMSVSLVWWWRSAEEVRALTERNDRSQQRLSRAMAPLDDKAQKDLAQEILAVNLPIRQMNQHWDQLLSDLKPLRSTVRVLEVEVEARTRRIRVTGTAVKLAELIDYVADLAGRTSLSEVALARHEPDQDNGGFRFRVEASWVDGR